MLHLWYYKCGMTSISTTIKIKASAKLNLINFICVCIYIKKDIGYHFQPYSSYLAKNTRRTIVVVKAIIVPPRVSKIFSSSTEIKILPHYLVLQKGNTILCITTLL